MDNKFDKIDDFLRDQLKDSSENPSWNVPGDHVFENAIHALPNKKKKYRIAWLIIPFLLLSVLIGREYFHSKQINQLENKISLLEKSIYEETPADRDFNSSIIPPSTTTLQSTNPSPTNSIDTEVADFNSEVTIPQHADLTEAEQFQESLSSDVQNNMIGNLTNELDGETHNNQFTTPESSANELPQNANTSEHVSVSTSELIELTETSPFNSETSENLLVDKSSLNELKQTDFIPTLPIAEFEYEIESPFIVVSYHNDSSKSSVKPFPSVRFGVLVGANTSWLTMQNIPESTTTRLYKYDNHQPGANVYTYLDKQLGNRITFQAGLGYQYYQNESVLEDEFLFQEDNVVLMPDGHKVYDAPVDVVNPLGNHSTMLAFRVSDEMQQNDLLTEYTSMKQKLHVVQLDLGINYTLLSKGKFQVSLGGGIGLGYLAGLNNDFSISCYHEGVLQNTWSETPKKMSHTNKWFGSAYGKMNVEYQISSQTNLVLETRYQGGLSSLRKSTEMNGSHTYLHSIGLSAGLIRMF